MWGAAAFMDQVSQFNVCHYVAGRPEIVGQTGVNPTGT
jgi:hypothetical protein